MTSFQQVTSRQQQMWARGDFHRIGVSQLVVGEMLVRALHVHAGERVLDVAGGAGNTALAAARRWADVTCTDYVPDLLEHAAARAATEGLPMVTGVADAQALPFPDGSFDVVTSTFGAMFAPDQALTATELLRVLRPGGRLGMANWTPSSWVGEQFALQSRYASPPPPPGLAPPSTWGTPDGLERLLGAGIASLAVTEQHADFVQQSTTALFGLFSTWFGPLTSLLSQLDDERAADCARDWIALADRHNIATDGTCEIPSPYLEVVATKIA